MLAQAIHKNIGCEDWLEIGYPGNEAYYIFHNRRKARVKCLASGWTMIQRREDGSTNFTQNWEGYKQGFGDPSGEYWLGNEMLHQLTKDSPMDIYLRAWSFDGKYIGVKYWGFWIEDEANKYRLHAGTYFGGSEANSGNWLGLDGAFFSTPDRDNDAHSNHCAKSYKAGWWMTGCGKIGLNGVYSQTAGIPDKKGIFWRSFRGDSTSLKAVTINIRRPLV